MKSEVYFSLVIISLVDMSTGNGNTTLKPYSVTSFEEIEEFYIRTRNLSKDVLREKNLQNQSQVSHQANTQSRTQVIVQKEICAKIFHVRAEDNTPFGDEVLLDPEIPTVRHHLMQRHRSIFDDLFQRVVEEKNTDPEKINSPSYRYANMPRPRQIVSRDEFFVEKVFSCVVRCQQSGTIKQYYVSENVYNVNKVRRGPDPIEGRFIFVKRDEARLKVHALAEDYSRFSVRNAYEVARYYLTKRLAHDPAQDATDDPICRLNRAERMRLCNSVFMYEQLWKQCVIGPGDGCALTLFSIPLLVGLPSQTRPEWMITCAVLRPDGPSTIYYVSRSYCNNRVFVYKYRNGGLKMHHYTSKVSVVRDEAPFVIRSFHKKR